jgi:hypothetical protein
MQTKIAGEQSKHARKQADATGAQSQILLLFTIVTIIFVSTLKTIPPLQVADTSLEASSIILHIVFRHGSSDCSGRE